MSGADAVAGERTGTTLLARRCGGLLRGGVARSCILLALCFASLFPISAVRGQGLEAESDLSLRSGFAPDPRALRGRVEAHRPASERFPGCDGYLSEHPQWTVDILGPLPFLRAFLVEAEGLQLLVEGPGRSPSCSGSGARARERVEGAFRPGRHVFWVATPEEEGARDLQLRFTEFPSTGPQGWVQGLSGASIGLRVSAREGANSTSRIGRGFLPDPLWQSGEFRGEVAIDLLGQRCQGWVSRSPNHLLHISEAMDYFRIQLRGERALSIMIRTPDARYLCAPISEEGRPSFSQSSWSSGSYRIWVGSQDRATTPYQMYYTESPRRGHSVPRAEPSDR